MSLPAPEPGLVIRYSFLWESESRGGRSEGAKDRPCAVIPVVEVEGEKCVAVLAITHTPPIDARDPVEIPADTKARLGLDHERSRIVVNELNLFRWPGPDLRFITERNPSSIIYGRLPPRFFDHVRDRFATNVRERRVRQVVRTE